MPSNVHTKGHCLCGNVKIAIDGAPLRMAQCHCRDCQRASGTGHVSNAIFREGDITVTGETKSFTVTADSGNSYSRHFCPQCGARLFAINTGRPGMIIMHVGMLDDSSWFAPEVVLYAQSRPAWDLVTDAVPHYDTAPPITPIS